VRIRIFGQVAAAVATETYQAHVLLRLARVHEVLVPHFVDDVLHLVFGRVVAHGPEEGRDLVQRDLPCKQDGM
jgi:hypothetical protein